MQHIYQVVFRFHALGERLWAKLENICVKNSRSVIAG